MTKKKAKVSEVLKKACFIVSPIGPSDSLTRNRVDQWMAHIYAPALSKEYEITRADMIAAPGLITEQIIQQIVDSDLVVIDYTELNPNVMYEAAIRHLSERPFIQIHPEGSRLPFDIHNMRSIPYDSGDIKYPERLVKDIKGALSEISKSNYEQPKVIKEKFDLRKIVDDPEKLVQLFTKYIKQPVELLNPKDAIVSVWPDHNPYISAAYGSKVIKCPRCGTIKQEYSDSASAFSALSASMYGYGKQHYHCNVCGNDFQLTD